MLFSLQVNLKNEERRGKNKIIDSHFFSVNLVIVAVLYFLQ